MFLGFSSRFFRIFFGWFSFVLHSVCYSNFLLLSFNFCYSFFCILVEFFVLGLLPCSTSGFVIVIVFVFGLATKWICLHAVEIWRKGGGQRAVGGAGWEICRPVASRSRLKVYRCESVNWHASALVFGFWNHTKKNDGKTEWKSICFFCPARIRIPDFWWTGVD